LGEPVIGANVIVAGTTNGATTDIDGNFSISNVADNATLNVSFIGYTSQSVPVNGRSQITVTLSEDSEMLDDVVVIGYQTVRRKDLTGSVASVNNKALAATPVSNVAQALQGKLPGVNVTSQDGRPDAASTSACVVVVRYLRATSH
jgi:outer membrane receptor for ferrienterochelin and colicin